MSVYAGSPKREPYGLPDPDDHSVLARLIRSAAPDIDPTPPAGVDRSPPSDSEVARIVATAKADIERAVTLAYRRGWVAGFAAPKEAP